MFGPGRSPNAIGEDDSWQVSADRPSVSRHTNLAELTSKSSQSDAFHVLCFGANRGWKKAEIGTYRAAMAEVLSSIDTEAGVEQFFAALDLGATRSAGQRSIIKSALIDSFRGQVPEFFLEQLDSRWRDAHRQKVPLGRLPSSMTYLFIADPGRRFIEGRPDFLGRYILSEERPFSLRLGAAHAYRDWSEAGNAVDSEAKVLLAELTSYKLIERVSSGLGGISGHGAFTKIDPALRRRYLLAVALSPVSFEARDFVRELRDRDVSKLDFEQRGVRVKCGVDWLQTFPNVLESPMAVLKARHSSVEEAALAVKSLQTLVPDVDNHKEIVWELLRMVPSNPVEALWQRFYSRSMDRIHTDLRASALAALALGDRFPDSKRLLINLRTKSVPSVRSWLEAVEARLARIGGSTVPRAEVGQPLDQVGDAGTAGA